MKRTGLLQPLDRVAPAAIQAKRAGPGPAGRYAGPAGPGERLDPATRSAMEGAFGHDFSAVRVHAGRQGDLASRALGAEAFAAGTDIGFRAGLYDPTSGRGRALLAHELAHVVQQSGRGAGPATGRSAEVEADGAAEAVTRGAGMPALSAVGPQVQRRVELRDVGRGEQSGFGRRDELIERLNELNCGLIFTLEADGTLTSAVDPAQTLNEFGRQMQGFTNPATPLVPLRLTNRHGLLGSTATGFNNQVDVDAWTSGYVDINDLLASDDLGLQSVLLHFLRERANTRRYANRIGTNTFTQAEFRRRHAEGIDAERDLLRDFFDDPTIRLVGDSVSPTIRRSYRNSRGDNIRRRRTASRGAETGVDAMTIEVRLRNGTIMTAEDYRDLLRREEEAAARRRLLELRGSPQVGPAP